MCETWPPIASKEMIEGIPAPLFEYAVRKAKQKLKVKGFRFKLEPQTQVLTAAQILFTHGYKSDVLLLDRETQDNM